jgi:hypothetical protein
MQLYLADSYLKKMLLILQIKMLFRFCNIRADSLFKTASQMLNKKDKEECREAELVLIEDN